MIQTIELDCAPGYPRPGDLIRDVVAGTALERYLGEPVSMSFGCWTYAFPEVSVETWRACQTITRPRIEALYRNGRIRYGSW